MSSATVSLVHVCKRYRHFSLGPVSLELPEGSIMGMVGPNGAGKSTILRLIMGLVRPDAGKIYVFGHPMPAQERAIKQEIGFVSEDMCLYGGASLGWHMRFTASLYPCWEEAVACQLLERFELNPDQLVRGMSRGQQVKAMLLLALSRHPRLLVMDEPTAGLDPLARRELLDELVPIVQAQGRAVLFSSHQTQDVEHICDMITFIDKGKVLVAGPTRDILGSGAANLEDVFLARVRSGAVSQR